ncbi:thiopeptide-type bacteriocin biosynthesis protein [Allocatelliglobosispora scoriae]|uniref:Thiopeptide-type bacteriocin biosynthesis protein n=1 Tax=Allocatelliglobosispora scoriae TaxID=643052 RepID=A0A841BIH5_9ACTN|nr:lantibiotic dehydratase [Allocatelliglobosispora scoriae]MBB5866701.1 thiopeptide-type bacteriocin biosynthesis protein [Allocatelliglobosispora scoriae]
MIPIAGAALIRAAAYPSGLTFPISPDLVSGQPEAWREWLCVAWALPRFAPAVMSAAPRLAEQIARAVGGEPMPRQRLRRLVESTLRYLLRWTTRATPFGCFAGVASVEFGARAAVRWGEAHHEVARPDGRFVAEHIAEAEQDLAVLRRVAVVANSLGYRRGGMWVLPCARADADRRWDVELRLTGPVEAAIQAAASPVMFADLTTRIAGMVPARVDAAERLLAGLVHTGVLLSELRPAMTAMDPNAHVARHYALPDPVDRVAVDLCVDASVTLPPAVLREAGRAASALVAVAPHLPGWSEYHHAFIARWGPGAAVPLREVLNVLGFPAGYRGSSRRAPAVFTARDRVLAELAQRSALDGCAEVVLDDELINRLRGDDDRPPVPHTELRFTLAAATLQDLDRGAFTLTVVSGARHAGVAAARFLHLLTTAELAAFRSAYQALPTALPGAELVQLSGPPLEGRMISVARVPELLPVLPVGDFHPDPQSTLTDLAVCGDGRRLWLVSLTSGRPVEPLLFNSVLLTGLQQPLMRFLAEIWTAWTAPCTPFDFGQMTSLPFLPRVRRGRTIVHPARWIIDRTDLPARAVSWPLWRDAWQRHRDHHRLPQEVLVGDDDVRLRLDLDDSTHLAVLRSHLDRQPRTVVTEAHGPAGWIDGRPAELLLTMTHTQPPATPPVRPARTAATIHHRPGHSPWLEAHLYGRLDDILTGVAGWLPAGWWFLRYPDPEPHLRLRIPLRDNDNFAEITRSLAQRAQHMESDGVLQDYTLHTYRPETRHGTGATLAAAETVFAADSLAALNRLTGDDRQAATAAGMITIADGFTGDGLRWLADHVPRRSGPRLDPAQLHLARISYRDEELAAALAAYRSLAEHDGFDTDQVLADLLHLHHARMIGVDTASERHCLRLVRTIARTNREPA